MNTIFADIRNMVSTSNGKLHMAGSGVNKVARRSKEVTGST